MNPSSVNVLVQQAAARAGLDPAAYSAHSSHRLRHLHPPPRSIDRAIAHQTRHPSLATLGQYVRIAQAWHDNAATQLGL